MKSTPKHPGVTLRKFLAIHNTSQRELSSTIQIAHSNLSGIISGSRNISVDMAVRLEAAGVKTAEFWLKEQMNYDLFSISNKSDFETESITNWKDIQNHVPINFFRQQNVLSDNRQDDINTIFEIYKSVDLSSFKNEIQDYKFKHFRKSSAFAETRTNVIAWSLLAEYNAAEINTSSQFDPSLENELVSKLKDLFVKNDKVIAKTKTLLSSYGIKFFTLDRPSKTPVDGKSFMSGANPAIVLSLKYKRLDNFAFTLMHELGHVFKHLTNKKLETESFFTNNSSTDLLEFEADSFARNNLISLEDWNKFEMSNKTFTDEVMIEFANKIKVHPAIVRGRVCFEHNKYYRRKSIITDLNKITDES